MPFTYPQQQWTTWPIYGPGDSGYSAGASGLSQVEWFTASVGSINAIGNGTAFFRFQRNAGYVVFTLYCFFGTTSNFDGAAWGYRGLPPFFNGPSGFGASAATVFVSHSAATYSGAAEITYSEGTATIPVIALSTTTSPVAPTVPFTWTAGDLLVLSGAIEAYGV